MKPTSELIKLILDGCAENIIENKLYERVKELFVIEAEGIFHFNKLTFEFKRDVIRVKFFMDDIFVVYIDREVENFKEGDSLTLMLEDGIGRLKVSAL